MGELLTRRRAASEERLQAFREELETAERDHGGRACVYVTGSFGRGEASPHSDLDLFVVGKDQGISHINEILIQADLIRAARTLSFPEFSGDAEYLRHISMQAMVASLGTPEDDATNTFTARCLLLLESRPLLGKTVYDDLIQQTIQRYWRDYEDHKDSFVPAFLANDVIRMWRTFCVNYEARTERTPADRKAKGKLKKYKLAHSRLLTCYSGLLYMLARYAAAGTVSPADAVEMVSLTPTQRMEWLLVLESQTPARPAIQRLIDMYEAFLDRTVIGEDELVSQFRDRTKAAELAKSSLAFGDCMFDVLQRVGATCDNGSFYRFMTV